MSTPSPLTRREAVKLGSASLCALGSSLAQEASRQRFKLRYVLSSAMYGTMPLDRILPEIPKAGAESIDIWCRVHGNQREQIEAMGDAAFRSLLAKHHSKVGVSTRYPLGPYGLGKEIAWLGKFGGGILVTGSGNLGQQEPQGKEARRQVANFLEAMKPHLELAAAHNVVIAIENHDRQMLYHPDSLKAFADLNKSPNLGVAFAFHHLTRWSQSIPTLLRYMGSEQIPFIYFQEHSEGIRKKVSKDIEMQQLPGKGRLDYRPIVRALRTMRYKGLVEIFMHPTPRGIPILPTVDEITGAINESRHYVEDCLKQL